jgi:hypothetical protein
MSDHDSYSDWNGVSLLKFSLVLRTCSWSPGAVMGALREKSSENKLAVAELSFAEEARGWIWHAVPLEVFDFAAAIADEVVVAHAFCVVTRGAAFDGDFSDQANFHQIAKIVVGGSA